MVPLRASRDGDRDPAVRRRQAHATARHQAGASASGERVMPRTTRFDAADYLDSEERQVAYITAAPGTRGPNFWPGAPGPLARPGQGANCKEIRSEPPKATPGACP